MIKTNFKSQIGKTKQGSVVTIRVARNSDAQSLLDLANAVVAEDIFQLLTPPELHLTIESEEEWIALYNSRPNRIILIAEVDGKLVGQLDFCNGQKIRLAHTGEFGMSIARDYRGQGIGQLLLKGLLDWAKSTGTIEKIGLNVHSNNLAAIALYKKMGFEVEGIRRKELKYGHNQYVDTVVMGLFI